MFFKFSKEQFASSFPHSFAQYYTYFLAIENLFIKISIAQQDHPCSICSCVHFELYLKSLFMLVLIVFFLFLHRVFSFKWRKILNFLAATHQVWNCSFPSAYIGIALNTDRERYWFVLDDMIQDIDSIIIEQTRLDTKIWKQFIECLLHVALDIKMEIGCDIQLFRQHKSHVR